MRAVTMELLLAIPALAVASRAQEVRPLIGRVVDATGKPLAGAAVTAAWNPAGRCGLATGAQAQASADARGYFKLTVPAGQLLFVWAVGPADDAGRRFASPPELTACGRERLELRARASVEPSRPKITGLQAWQELAPFRVRVHPCAQVDLAIEADVTADGDVALPPLPPGAPCAELLDKAGATLHGWTYLQTNGESPVPPPQQLPLLAVDADGKPVAGARILHRSADLRRWDGGFLSTGPRERWRLVATTGADGKATALLPLAADPTQPDQKPDSLVLLAQQDGCADSHSGFEDGWFVDGKKLAEQPQRLTELRFVLAPAMPLRGKLALPGKLAGGEPVRVTWTSKIAFENGWTHLPRSATVTLAADATFALPGLPLDAYELAFAIGPQALADARAPVRVALPLSAERPAGDFKLAGAGNLLAFQASDADGAPCPGALALVLSRQHDSYDVDPPAVTFALDLQGRGEVWLPDGDWLLVLVDERGYAFERLTAGAEPAARPVLKLQPFEEVQGVVVDEQGAPVAGARVSVFRSRSSGGRRDAEGQALDAIAQLARQRYLNAVTEADGRFRLRFLSRPGTSMEARAAFEGKRSEGFPVAPTAEPLRLEVR